MSGSLGVGRQGVGAGAWGPGGGGPARLTLATPPHPIPPGSLPNPLQLLLPEVVRLFLLLLLLLLLLVSNDVNLTLSDLS